MTQPSDEAAGRPAAGDPVPAAAAHAPGPVPPEQPRPPQYGPPPGHPAGPPQGYPAGPQQGYPAGPQQGYPSGPPQGPPPGYPAGPRQGYPTGPPQYPPYYQQGGYRPMPPPLSPAGQPLADFGSRLGAYIIDVAVIYAVTMVVALPVYFIVVFGRMQDMMAQAQTYPPQQPDFGAIIGPILIFEGAVLVFTLVASYVYYVEIMYRSGQTFGKKALNIRVVPIQPGAPLTRGIAAKRFLLQFVANSIVPGLGLLDGLWQLWDKPYLQTLHDKFAQTVVVKVSP